jgi:hypothetical protein
LKNIEMGGFVFKGVVFRVREREKQSGQGPSWFVEGDVRVFV